MRLSTEIYTKKVVESRDFYLKYFNFRVKKEIDGFVVLQHKIIPAYEIMFCVPESPFVNEIFHPEFSGKGIIFQIEVEDVSAEYERLNNLKVPIVLKLISEPVNGKHFTIKDPNDILIDIVQYN